MLIEQTISFVEIIIYSSMALFILTTLYLIVIVKKHVLMFIENSVSNPVFSNLDMIFLKNLRIKYIDTGRKKSIAYINLYSFYTLIVSFFVLFIGSIVLELTRY